MKGRQRRGEAGFTLVEVMVAAVVLTIGVLGAAQMLNIANKSANTGSARNGATNIARRLIEAARSIPARNLSSATLNASLRAAATDLVDSNPSDTAWTVVRRGWTYTLTASTCTLDDATDGIAPPAQKDATYCTTTATPTADGQPADSQQVSVTVGYTASGRTTSVKQVTQVAFGSGTVLPTVKTLSMTSPSACATTCAPITSAATTSAAFSATTANGPATFTWLLGGNPQETCPPVTGTCSGSGNAWSFTWNLGTPVKDGNGRCIAGNYTLDGTYDVGARAQDANGLAGSGASMSVSLNRCTPLMPSGLNVTGRDADTTVIDTSWNANAEGDIVGYRVYKGTSTTSITTPVCWSPTGSPPYMPDDGTTECVDAAPGGYQNKNWPIYYGVVALDRDASGALRESAMTYLDTSTGNSAPNAPTTLAVSSSAVGRTLTWKLPSALDYDNGDTIDSFRIYRRAAAVASGNPTVPTDRLDRDSLAQLCNGTTTTATCTYVDTTATAGTTYTYWVSAVDTHLRESAFTPPVKNP